MEQNKFMPKNTFIKSSVNSSLNGLIDSVVFRTVELAQSDLCEWKIVPPNHLTSLDFFFGHPFKTMDLNKGKEVPYKATAIRGCRILAKNSIAYDHTFSSVSIKFTPTGLYSILGLDMEKLTNADIPCGQLKLPFDINKLYKAIEQTTNQESLISVVETTFQSVLDRPPAKSRLSDFLSDDFNSDNQQIFLSARQQQRLFKKEIGLSPKTFYNLRRFSNLLRAKKQDRNLSWTSLAHEFGYFDQAHLIKAFYFFLGIAPSLFRIENFAL